MGFGKNLRKLREAKDTTLRQFAMQCDVSVTYMSKIEREDFPPPSAQTIQRIADVLGIDGDLMALGAGKIPEWMKDILFTEGAACAEAMREIKAERERNNK